MLVIRMQRVGRKGHAQFRVVVQDSRRTPTSGKIVAQVGSFNPHTKETILDKEKTSFYLEHGAQPSPRVIRLLKAEKIKLPEWVSEPAQGKRAVRNPEKRRSTAPAEPKAPAEKAEEPAQEPTPDTTVEETVPSESASEQPAEQADEEAKQPEA
jgi:small subunit ribosomal protein S16